MEEIDLCWRAHNLKQNVKYIGCSTVYHLGGASLSKNNPKKTFYNFRNSLFALTKNSNRPLFTTILLRLILDGFAGIYFLLSGKITHTLAIIKAHVSFYSSIPDLLKFRNKQQRSSYDSHSSIVWRYFIKKRKIFQSHTNR
jgi:GT2 family glycosyltransferase